MIENQRILAVVPARSGSKGIPGKNLQVIGGLSLIALAAQTLTHPDCACVDRRVLSTDSPAYAEEGLRHGLDSPFLRPQELSTDTTGAVETMCHALLAMEALDGVRYDILLIVEPTCPFREPQDICGTLNLLVSTGAPSVVTVSRLDTKYHPLKILRKAEDDTLHFYDPEAAKAVVYRQSLPPYYYRNGACYALSRKTLIEERRIFAEGTRPFLIDRPLVNLDEPLDLQFARWLADQQTL